jgi:hypothetical protein
LPAFDAALSPSGIGVAPARITITTGRDALPEAPPDAYIIVVIVCNLV